MNQRGGAFAYGRQDLARGGEWVQKNKGNLASGAVNGKLFGC